MNKRSEIINVLCSSDENYAPYVSTTIASIMLNTKNQVDFAESVRNLGIKTLDLNLKYLDQDVLNVILSPNKYKPLDSKWCVMYKHLKFYYTKDQIRSIKKHQAIIHYPGGEIWKPWNNRFLISGKYFQRSIRYTSFEKEIRATQKGGIRILALYIYTLIGRFNVSSG